jgi:hypothetical protein
MASLTAVSKCVSARRDDTRHREIVTPDASRPEAAWPTVAAMTSPAAAVPTTAATGGVRLLLVNSAVAYTIALMVMITLHELAHAAAGLAQGLRPTVYPNQVAYAVTGTAGQQLTTALSGPVASLLIGLALLAAFPVARGFWGLLLFWLGTLDVQEFCGYLVTGPFFSAGDIGAALHLLAAPAWAYALVFLAGAAGTVALGRVATRRLLSMTSPGGGSSSTQLRFLGLFAWLLGTGLFILASVPNPSRLFTPIGLFELLGAITAGIFVLAVRFFMGREHPPQRGLTVGWPIAGIVLMVAVALVRHFVLGPGLALG